jgi:hypothetical protein
LGVVGEPVGEHERSQRPAPESDPAHRLGDPDQHPALGRSTLAAESLLAVFQLTMTDAVEKAFGREVERSPKKR